jgi:hypothetical protein
MASIKKLLDPNSILNPYNVLPQSVLYAVAEILSRPVVEKEKNKRTKLPAN